MNNYYVSNNNGRFTFPISRYKAIRMMIQYGWNLEFGETVYVENENGDLLYKKSWFEKRATKL